MLTCTYYVLCCRMYIVYYKVFSLQRSVLQTGAFVWLVVITLLRVVWRCVWVDCGALLQMTFGTFVTAEWSVDSLDIIPLVRKRESQFACSKHVHVDVQHMVPWAIALLSSN